MLLFVELFVLAAVLFFIAYPLLGRKAATAGRETLTESDLSDLLYRKEAAYTALKDLEFDHKTGKIDDGDYMDLKARFEAEALAILKDVEDYKQGKGAIVQRSRTASGGGKKFCSGCGAEVNAEDKFCHECGAGLRS